MNKKMKKATQTPTLPTQEATPMPPAEVIPPAAPEGPTPEQNALLEEQKALLLRLAEIKSQLPAPTRLQKSTLESPVKKVFEIANSMPGARRKDVIEAAVKAGVAFYTARTQYQVWYKASKGK